MSHAEAASALHTQLQRVAALHASKPQAWTSDLLALAHWQAARLRRTYADLAAAPRYEAAARFFFDDLYGPHDFAQRDADVERVYPVMAKLLPARALSTVASAMEVNALTQELDRALVRVLREDGTVDAGLTVARYTQAYRRCDNRDARERQIQLINHVGRELDALVNLPFIYTTLKLLRGPSRLAGLRELQDFLERGFAAFRAMGGAEEFLATLHEREMQILQRLFAGDDAPFA